MEQPLNEDARRMLEELRVAGAKRRVEDDAAIGEAKRTLGKEPFDIEVLQRYYDVSLDTRGYPLSPGGIRDYERKYYLLAPEEVRTMKQFADHLYYLYTNDCG